VRCCVRYCYVIAISCLLYLAGCSTASKKVPATTNQAAILDGALPYNPLRWEVITSAVNRKDSQIYTIFGNRPAVLYARKDVQGSYPIGSVISKVAWKQREDPRWFGGLIPDYPESVEFVTVEAGPNAVPEYVYAEYTGRPLTIAISRRETEPGARTASLLAQRAAFMP
jgi:hypothetical protein